MKWAGKVLSNPGWYNSLGKLTRWALRQLPRPFLYNSFNEWGRDRELPQPPRQSFKEWYQNKKTEK